MMLGISRTFNLSEHNILMHPFRMLGVAGVFGGALFSVIVLVFSWLKNACVAPKSFEGFSLLLHALVNAIAR